jgi:hypothetical protein
MHPLRKLRESGAKPTPAQVGELLAENIVFNSPILARPIQGREVIRRFSLSRALLVVLVRIQLSLSSMSAPPSCAGWGPWTATSSRVWRSLWITKRG